MREDNIKLKANLENLEKELQKSNSDIKLKEEKIASLENQISEVEKMNRTKNESIKSHEIGQVKVYIIR